MYFSTYSGFLRKCWRVLESRQIPKDLIQIVFLPPLGHRSRNGFPALQHESCLWPGNQYCGREENWKLFLGWPFIVCLVIFCCFLRFKLECFCQAILQRCPRQGKVLVYLREHREICWRKTSLGKGNSVLQMIWNCINLVGFFAKPMLTKDLKYT